MVELWAILFSAVRDYSIKECPTNNLHLEIDWNLHKKKKESISYFCQWTMLGYREWKQINLCIKNMFKAIDSKFSAVIPEYAYTLQARKM